MELDSAGTKNVRSGNWTRASAHRSQHPYQLDHYALVRKTHHPINLFNALRLQFSTLLHVPFTPTEPYTFCSIFTWILGPGLDAMSEVWLVWFSDFRLSDFQTFWLSYCVICLCQCLILWLCSRRTVMCRSSHPRFHFKCKTVKSWRNSIKLRSAIGCTHKVYVLIQCNGDVAARAWRSSQMILNSMKERTSGLSCKQWCDDDLITPTRE